MNPLQALAPIGDFTLFGAGVLRTLASKQFSARSFVRQIRQMERVGVESLTVINLCSFFISLVLVVQISSILARFGAKTEVCSVIGVSFVREIGPVFAAIMFTGRIGTAIAAELASMVASEQVDALRVMGANPMDLLVGPRVIACTLMLPVLTAIADLVGIFSGFLAAMYTVDIGPGEFARKALEGLEFLDIAASLTKGTCFGLLIGLIATYTGMRAERTAESVGKVTTRTMVAGVLGILAVDFLLTNVFLGLARS